MTYTSYYLRFSSQEEAETKLTEVNYRHEEQYYEQIVTEAPEPDEYGNPIFNITYGDELLTRVWYSVTDQVGDVDIVGDIYNNDGVYDEETFEVITPPTKKEGYHINLILAGAPPSALLEFMVSPQNPHRVFA
jgi:hypothetical protein